MFKFLTAPVLATSIALTGFSTTPVRADDSDVAKFIAGFAALAIIGAAINESQSNKKVTVHKHYNKPKVHHRPHVHHTYKPKPQPKPKMTKVVPARCLVHLNTRDGKRRGFGNGCLSKYSRHYKNLPRYCKSTVKSNGQWRTYFNAQCLQNAGWRMTRI